MGKTIPKPFPKESKEDYRKRLQEHLDKYYNKIPAAECFR